MARHRELEIRGSPLTISVMEISLAPEVEAKLAKIASEAGKAANQVVQELVADYLDHDEWFKREVRKGLHSLDDGKFVSHEEVGRQIERILGS
jgi:predicted transcriptional regulator